MPLHTYYLASIYFVFGICKFEVVKHNIFMIMYPVKKNPHSIPNIHLINKTNKP
jgi:hypothetical protein